MESADGRIVALCASADEAEEFCHAHADLFDELSYAAFPLGYRFGG